MEQIKFDFNNMLTFNIGKAHGVSSFEISELSGVINKAYSHIRSVLVDDKKRVSLGLEWANLPYQDREFTSGIQKLGEEIARRYKNVLFLGIGGSYLGLKAAQDALRPPYHNEFPALRPGRPRIYFEGNNLDPETLSVLLNNLNPRQTYVIVISKSGETAETKAAFSVVEPWLKKGVGKNYKRQVFVITDPESGNLRRRVCQEQAKDYLSFRSLPLFKGVGGRYSVLNIGLLHLAIIGVEIQRVLSGARSMAERCSQPIIYKNPALMYAVLQTILYREKGKPISILMPFSEMLKSSADWYCQLLAESTGKKYSRLVKVYPDGKEIWRQDKSHILNNGRTPIASRGTNDLHSLQQNNTEGENDKTITFIRVDRFSEDIKVSKTGGFLSGRRYSQLLALAQEATEWALVRDSRPNCTIILPQLNPRHWGEMVFFFEMATAFEAELLNVNAFDQPGVEGYKNYMYYKLHKQGISPEVVRLIRKNPILKQPRFII